MTTTSQDGSHQASDRLHPAETSFKVPEKDRDLDLSCDHNIKKVATNWHGFAVEPTDSL